MNPGQINQAQLVSVLHNRSLGKLIFVANALDTLFVKFVKFARFTTPKSEFTPKINEP